MTLLLSLLAGATVGFAAWVVASGHDPASIGVAVGAAAGMALIALTTAIGLGPRQ